MIFYLTLLANLTTFRIWQKKFIVKKLHGQRNTLLLTTLWQSYNPSLDFLLVAPFQNLTTFQIYNRVHVLKEAKCGNKRVACDIDNRMIIAGQSKPEIILLINFPASPKTVTLLHVV
jgi:hypothetical protein